jgi:peroxiredoxin
VPNSPLPRLLLALAAGGAFFLAFSCAAHRPVEYSEKRVLSGENLVGKPVPAFTAVTTDRKTVSPAQARGKVLLIQLWGVNCASCLEEMAFFNSTLYPKYRARGLEIWGVNADQIDREEVLRGMVRVEAQADYPILVDPSGDVTRLFASWFIPVTAIVDRQGIVQYYKVGFGRDDREKVRSRIESLLP